MSNTRRQTGNGPLRQERFASSQEFQRGLMANLVAKRCSVLERAEDRELVWFLQQLSHERGGLSQLAADVLKRFPDRIVTPSMQRFGFKTGQIYSAKQVKAIRAEIANSEDEFLLRGEMTLEEQVGCLGADDVNRSQTRPHSYPASAFVERCNAAAKSLVDFLERTCLDPAVNMRDGGPWYFPTLFATLREIQSGWIKARRAIAITSIGKRLHDALDYADDTRRLVIVDGIARIGKSHATKDWCLSKPGRARFVECPSSNDDFTFFRDIARSLGLSINLNSKANELRARIEETLQGGDLMLVVDEAHYLWPQGRASRNTTPARVNWLMTALVNFGVPVALITTPQFFRSQHLIERTTCWMSDQFIGRIGHYEKLPDSLPRKDLVAVARAVLPDADAESIEALVLYARNSQKRLAGIDDVADRARYMVRKAGRKTIVLRDVMLAIDESVIPSDRAFSNAMKSVMTPTRRRPARVSASPLQDDFNRVDSALPGHAMRPALAQSSRNAGTRVLADRDPVAV